jgi:hypothetical protein
MPSLLDELVKKGLATQTDLHARDSEEAYNLRLKQAQFVPKTLKELVACKGYNFYDKVRWLIDSLEESSSPSWAIEVQKFVEANMTNGDAGKEFLSQLQELFAGTSDMISIKAKWPKIWKA